MRPQSQWSGTCRERPSAHAHQEHLTLSICSWGSLRECLFPLSFLHQTTWVRPLCREPAHCILSAYCILSAALSTASSFRIWNSSAGILSLPGASARNSARGKGHEEGGSAYTKAGSSLRSPPGNSRASIPKTRVCLLSALCFHPHL